MGRNTDPIGNIIGGCCLLLGALPQKANNLTDFRQAPTLDYGTAEALGFIHKIAPRLKRMYSPLASG